MLLSTRAISLAYGEKTILNHIDIALNPGEHAGLVGANGVGKSSLLRIIAGQSDGHSGTVQVRQGVMLGYLPQEVPITPGQTVQGLLDDALAPIHALAEQMRQLEAAMAAPDADLDAVFAEYDAVTQAFELSGGYDIDTRIEQVIEGLNLGHIERERLLSTLSGGERSRFGLAAMLVQSPGLLLLDEPTNHIDQESLAWLEDYLAAYRGGVLIVSHDRTFLNKTVNRIIEIDEHTREAVSYSGSYDAYAQEKARRVQQWEENYAAQQEEIKMLRQMVKQKSQPTNNRNIRTTDNDKFIKHFKGQTADKTQARELHTAEERLRRLEAEALPRPPKPLEINPDLDPAALHGDFPLSVSGISKGYDGRMILHDVTLSVGAGERIAITGPNGSGKSTLLKLMAGAETPDEGTVTLAGSARIGYLPQVDALPPGETLIEAYGYDLPGTYEDHKAELIRSGFFTYPELSAPVAGLSAGQRRKLQLARLIAQRANLLLLDEPTNHLSFDVIEAFEAALDDFPGVVIAVSHDRRFLERFGGMTYPIGDLNGQPTPR